MMSNKVTLEQPARDLFTLADRIVNHTAVDRIDYTLTREDARAILWASMLVAGHNCKYEVADREETL